MIWWDLAANLTTHLAGAIPTAEIVIGAAGNAPTVPTIRVRPTADESADPVAIVAYRGTCLIRLECWGHDPVDQSSAYEALAALNDTVLAALRTWKPEGISFDDLLVNVAFDEDLFQPSVGNLITVTAQWRRNDVF